MRRMLLSCFAILSFPALAHEAKSGWSYAPECCSGRDCREISEDAVRVEPQGWQVKATGEVFNYRQVKMSQDGHFHRCSAGFPGSEVGKTFCLYVPPNSY